MKRERFIPYRRSDVVAMCKKHAKFYKVDENEFNRFCKLTTALFHFELHKNTGIPQKFLCSI